MVGYGALGITVAGGKAAIDVLSAVPDAFVNARDAARKTLEQLGAERKKVVMDVRMAFRDARMRFDAAKTAFRTSLRAPFQLESYFDAAYANQQEHHWYQHILEMLQKSTEERKAVYDTMSPEQRGRYNQTVQWYMMKWQQQRAAQEASQQVWDAYQRTAPGTSSTS